MFAGGLGFEEAILNVGLRLARRLTRRLNLRSGSGQLNWPFRISHFF